MPLTRKGSRKTSRARSGAATNPCRLRRRTSDRRVGGLTDAPRGPGVHLLGVERRVSDHDVPVYGYGQYGEQRHGQQPVSDQREETAQQLAVHPRPVPERGGGQRQVETAEAQVGHAQVDDEHGRRVAHLKQARRVRKGYNDGEDTRGGVVGRSRFRTFHRVSYEPA